jgi:polysaccharide deacetylase 2 family uncharacterized protein YibQ
VNRRRLSRRRRSTVVAAAKVRVRPASSLISAPGLLNWLHRAVPMIRQWAAATVGGMRALGLRVATDSAVHLPAFPKWARGKAEIAARRCGLHLSKIAAGMAALQTGLVRAIARGWSAANRNIELPDAEASLRPYLQAAIGAFALVAVSVAIFTAWHTLRGNPEPVAASFAALRDHHPPLANKAAYAPSGDLEAEIVSLPLGPEDEAEESRSTMLAEAEDIDAQDWFDDSFLALYEAEAGDTTPAADEENLETALAGLSPRAQPRPEIPPKPAVTGIPIQPEPPFGKAPRQLSQPKWLANAVEPRQGGNGPMIAIVIDDAGVVQHRTKRASELPAPITIAFIPYSNNLESQTGYARSRGHELLLHMPMEPGSAAADPGHNALLTSLGQEEIIRRLRWALDRFDGYVGVNNHMGSKFMAQPEVVRPVLEEINARGLLFLDSRTDHRTVGGELAREIGMPNATRNVFLDNDLDKEKIAAQLAQVEKIARKRGQAIAIGHPHDVTVEVLARWIPEARRKGFRLVPVSAIVKKEYETQLASAAGRGETNRFLGGAQ